MCLAVPGKVIDITNIDGLRMGRVDFGGVLRQVCLEHVDAEPGDHVLVHVGFALSKLTAPEAEELTEMLRQITGGEEVEASE